MVIVRIRVRDVCQGTKRLGTKRLGYEMSGNSFKLIHADVFAFERDF